VFKNIKIWHPLFSLFVLLLSGFVYGQNPSHFILGQSELKNADIYSILQTENKKIYVSTDEGLYEYRHGKMQHINSAHDQKGISLFTLTANSKNEVFCLNLSGQVLRVKNNKLEVYLEIPKKYLTMNLQCLAKQ